LPGGRHIVLAYGGTELSLCYWGDIKSMVGWRGNFWRK
jgi:hypothetical protein